MGDGARHIFNPGDALLSGDLTERGHAVAVYGGTPCVSVAIPITD